MMTRAEGIADWARARRGRFAGCRGLVAATLLVFSAISTNVMKADEASILLGQNPEVARWQIRGEYLAWWTNGNDLPPLVSTSPPGTLRPDAGVLGTPGAATLYGGSGIDNQLRSGGRLTVSREFAFDPGLALEGVLLFVDDDTQSGDFAAASLGTPILARPFRSAQLNAENSELVAYPNRVEGIVQVTSSSEIYAAELLGKMNMAVGPLGRIDLVGGYRFFQLQESLRVRELLTSTDPGGLVPLGTQFDLFDQFSTDNDFHGAELGINVQVVNDIFTLEAVAKAALGNLHRVTRIDGATMVTLPGIGPTTTAGGLLALPSNIGSYADNTLAVLPEFGLTGTIAVTPRLTCIVGYTLIHLNDVLRTGDQIDRVLNTSQIGGQPLLGAARPGYPAAGSGLWLHGASVGLDFRW